ncbi:hypothetical protein [Kribbella sp.]|uniref:hypothetical protein n=1 Tax=Kribbella sp. TaxID=1871183 RepID=UPI002D4EDA1F|nr:hypothetical protein [Kribbella sp.]HZX09094.1 hypothetical protein [Kribbella sp.]
MNNSTPEIPGYQFDQRILQHPLAELWHGRTFTGMEIVALVLSEAGARNQTVVDRLASASRDAALVPGQQEAPLWAASFNADRPYAITQLIPGQTGAERLIDPLDGIAGNDEESLRAVREQLSRYGGTAPVLPQQAQPQQSIPSYVDRPAPEQPPTEQPPAEPSRIEIARQYRRKIGPWAYAVVAVVVLIVFTIAYSVGTAIGSAVKDKPAAAPEAAAVSPEPYPSRVLIPPINRPTTAAYKRPDGSAGVFGATYPAGADVQVVANAELPFAFGWPRPPQVDFLGESSQLVLRRVVTASAYDPAGMRNSMRVQFALHPCATLAKCLTDRPAFDEQWTKIYRTTAPATAKDARTWLTVSTATPYTITMTRAFQSAGQWWLVGVMAYGQTVEAPDVQRLVNDIWRQTS